MTEKCLLPPPEEFFVPVSEGQTANMPIVIGSEPSSPIKGVVEQTEADTTGLEEDAVVAQDDGEVLSEHGGEGGD